MYYILEANNELRKIYYLTYENGDGWGLDFLKGESIELRADSNRLFVKFECEKTKLPDFFEVNGVPVANEKLIKVFEGVGVNNFQAFPVEIQFENGSISGYYVFNIVGCFSVINMETTSCSKFGPSIARIFDLKLNPESANGAEMYREHRYKEIIFVSENIKKRIEEHTILGCNVSEANGWNDSHRF